METCGGGAVEQEEVMQQKVPRCPSCRGVVKPDITFFGEKLPGSVKRAVEADHKKVWGMDRSGKRKRTKCGVTYNISTVCVICVSSRGLLRPVNSS